MWFAGFMGSYGSQRGVSEPAKRRARSQVWVEPLEGRSYLSVSPVVGSDSPDNVTVNITSTQSLTEMAGATSNDKVTLDLATSGTTNSVISLQLWLTPSPTETSSNAQTDIQLTPTSAPPFLPQGSLPGTTSFSLTLGAIPSQLGTYYMLVLPQSSSSSDQTSGANSGALSTPVTLTIVTTLPPPPVTPDSVSVTFNGLQPLTESAGMSSTDSVNVDVANSATSNGEIDVDLWLTSSPTTTTPSTTNGDVELGTAALAAGTAAGTHTLNIPLGTLPNQAGTEYLVAVVSPTNSSDTPTAAGINSGSLSTPIAITVQPSANTPVPTAALSPNPAPLKALPGLVRRIISVPLTNTGTTTLAAGSVAVTMGISATNDGTGFIALNSTASNKTPIKAKRTARLAESLGTLPNVTPGSYYLVEQVNGLPRALFEYVSSKPIVLVEQAPQITVAVAPPTTPPVVYSSQYAPGLVHVTVTNAANSISGAVSLTMNIVNSGGGNSPAQQRRQTIIVPAGGATGSSRTVSFPIGQVGRNSAANTYFARVTSVINGTSMTTTSATPVLIVSVLQMAVTPLAGLFTPGSGTSQQSIVVTLTSSGGNAARGTLTLTGLLSQDGSITTPMKAPAQGFYIPAGQSAVLTFNLPLAVPTTPEQYILLAQTRPDFGHSMLFSSAPLLTVT
jgi:hypothetical protein